MICLSLIILSNLNCQESKKKDIVQILNNKGIATKHASKLPIWGKYTYDQRSLNKRGFILFEDGSIYNYSSSSEFPDDEWKNWGLISTEYVQKIKNSIIEMDNTINSPNQNEELDHGTIMIQYHFESASNLTIISKSYNTNSGKILKRINDLVNEGLAARSKK